MSDIKQIGELLPNSDGGNVIPFPTLAEMKGCEACKGEGYVIDMERRAATVCDCNLGQYLGMLYDCAVCEDKHIIQGRKGDEMVIAGCPFCDGGRQYNVLKGQKRFSGAGIPSAYAEMTFTSFWDLPPEKRHGKQIAALMCEYMALNLGRKFAPIEAAGSIAPHLPDEPRLANIMLRGDYGLGKTGLLAATANALMDGGYSVLYIRASSLIREITDTYGERGVTATQKIRAVENYDVVLVDDFNLVQPTRHSQQVAEDIVRTIHGTNRYWVATTNLTLDEFEAMWGPRTSEIMRMGHWVRLQGDVLRTRIHSEVGGV